MNRDMKIYVLFVGVPVALFVGLMLYSTAWDSGYSHRLHEQVWLVAKNTSEPNAIIVEGVFAYEHDAMHYAARDDERVKRFLWPQSLTKGIGSQPWAATVPHYVYGAPWHIGDTAWQPPKRPADKLAGGLRPDLLPAHSLKPPIIEQGVEVSAAELKPEPETEKVEAITHYGRFVEAIVDAKDDPPAMARLQERWNGKRVAFESSIVKVIPDGDTSHYRISCQGELRQGVLANTDAVFPVKGHFDPAMPIGTRAAFIATIQNINSLGVLYADAEVLTLDDVLNVVPLTSKNIQSHNKSEQSK